MSAKTQRIKAILSKKEKKTENEVTGIFRLICSMHRRLETEESGGLQYNIACKKKERQNFYFRKIKSEKMPSYVEHARDSRRNGRKSNDRKARLPGPGV